MSNLISGKEALIALANGESVEYKSLNSPSAWHDAGLLSVNTVLRFDDSCIAFRLKPSTITINGIEVPACGVDYKPHTFMFVLNSLEPCGYSKIILDESDETPAYWWSKEEEIKQVVAALRSIFSTQGK